MMKGGMKMKWKGVDIHLFQAYGEDYGFHTLPTLWFPGIHLSSFNCSDQHNLGPGQKTNQMNKRVDKKVTGSGTLLESHLESF